MKLTLGTAQFGLNYGLANSNGKIAFQEAEAILNLAEESNINSIDTAILYGESEKILGKIGIEGWKITSKIPEIALNSGNVRNILFSNVNQSLNRLKVNHLESILLHRPLQILEKGGKDIVSALKDLKTEGLVMKVGISVYDPEEIDLIWPKFQPDVVQAPYNIFDRRLQTSLWLDRLFDDGILVDSRSAFLQGVLLMNIENQLQAFPEWHNLWLRWHNWLIQNNIGALEACLSFQSSQEKIHKTIIGVDSRIQLQEILSSKLETNLIFPDDLSVKDENLINPSLWRIK